MRLHLLFVLSLALACALPAFAQEGTSKAVPTTQVQELAGKSAPFTSFVNPDGPTIVSFWATWCKPCIVELNAFEEHFATLAASQKLRLLAVSVDDARSLGRVGPFVASRGWPYTVLLDPNADLKRAFNVANVPHTFLLDATGRIVWQHSSYNPGDEDELAEEVKKLAK
jgi:cytochrome c biogenesis protein CcmG, thiol:disulfide interchange protein DsbE